MKSFRTSKRRKVLEVLEVLELLNDENKERNKEVGRRVWKDKKLKTQNCFVCVKNSNEKQSNHRILVFRTNTN